MCRSAMTEEDDSFLSDKSIEEKNKGMGKSAVGMQMGMLRAGYRSRG